MDVLICAIIDAWELRHFSDTQLMNSSKSCQVVFDHLNALNNTSMLLPCTCKVFHIAGFNLTSGGSLSALQRTLFVAGRCSRKI